MCVCIVETRYVAGTYPPPLFRYTLLPNASRDLRKIPEIVDEEEGEIVTLKLGRRGPEFPKHDLSPLAKPFWIDAGVFDKLTYISLYGNDIVSLKGIERFKETPLKILNLGNNAIRELPDAFGT